MNKNGFMKLTAIVVVILLAVSTAGVFILMTHDGSSSASLSKNDPSFPAVVDDTNDNPLDAGCGCDLYSSQTTTFLGVSTITLGQSVTDNATVIGKGAGYPVPTGTVNFQVSFNDGAWSTFSAGVALVNGAAISTWYTPISTGNYDFRAIYSGDSKYLASQSGNGDEPLVVESGLGEVSVTTLLSDTIITLGDSITDDVTVASMGDPTPVPTGTVEFQVQIGAGVWTTFDRRHCPHRAMTG